MKEYTVNEGEFTFKDYEKKPAFSSFLPGLTGEDGIPMWVFYTNRGQAIASAGINSKSEAIIEFNPACTEYENTELKGYRTFIRVNGRLYEPFRTSNSALRTMTVRKNSLRITEVAEEYGIKISVDYFVLPQESIGALGRIVKIENIGSCSDAELEIVDGVARIIPRGISNGQFQEMGNLFKSWTDVKNTANNAPFFAMRASTDDSSEVEEIKGGYFYAGCMEGELLPFVCDTEEIFGYDTSLSFPRALEANKLADIKASRPIVNKVPCAFSLVSRKLEAGRDMSFTSYLGYAPSVEELNDRLKTLTEDGYSLRALNIAEELCNELTSDVRTSTAIAEFDKYVEQCYLDNFLRGGYPVTIGEGENKSVLYLYSRKHGDPERDYNYFTIDGAYYSQGNGNFRDVCQNRRNDVFFCPEMDDYNVRSFMNFMQLDGYNPLEIRPATFTVRPEKKAEALSILAAGGAGEASEKIFGELISKRFKPGDIFKKYTEARLDIAKNPKALMEELLPLCEEHSEAGAGEGYWSDHWDYCLDLIENYLSVFPDKEAELLNAGGYRYYDNEMVVKERNETYVLQNGKIWQFGSMTRDKAKMEAPDFKVNGTNWKKNADGSYVEVTLLTKLLSLALIKYATLDAYGMGIEMEGGKPGWNDAMNGLPGMLASSMPETFELIRLCEYLKSGLNFAKDSMIAVPSELADLFKGLVCLKDGAGFEHWDATASLREEFRARTKYALKGESTELKASEVADFVDTMLVRLKDGVDTAKSLSNGKIPTYFTYTVTKYEELKGEDGKLLTDEAGRTRVKPLGLRADAVPMFLEGYARYLNAGVEDAKEIYELVQQSELYDKKLGMYRTSESLEDMSLQYGRIRAFTPGWLERESIFLHMEYKYLVALQKNKLYDEFYKAMKTAFVPFMDPAVYGRSTLENSSFIASSANPDEKVHGRGFVARLSGSTTEVITMWIRMFVGEHVFRFENQTLKLTLAPTLPEWMFDTNDEASFTFMGRCRVVYTNHSRKNTYGETAATVKSMALLTTGGEIINVEGNTLAGETAQMVRDGKIVRIDAIMD